MAIESATPSPAAVPPRPHGEPREQGPSNDAVAFERWISSEREAGGSSNASSEQTVHAGTVSATRVSNTVDQSLALDSIVFEWMSTATYLMSYVDHRSRGQDAVAPSVAALDVNARPSVLAGSGLHALNLQQSTHSASFASGSQIVGAGLPVISTAHTAADANASSRASSASSAGALAEWMTRAMRQISDAQGRSTWWIRDYRLSSTQIPALLDAVLHSVQGQPDRIMLNGALVWQRSSNTHGVNNNGD
ncbi:hypothetical protein [Xanthomonas melonis]|uniref:hypothetical protein n=1 Tax=Xanthomonas melonis TaxID=56456 RepID=UPI003EBC189F